MSRPLRYISKAADFLLTLAVILLLTGTLGGLITGRGFNISGIRPVVILSGSMEPAIMTNAVAIVMETDEYSTGDIIMFTEGDTCVVHRCIGITEDGSVITKGDNNPTADLRTHTRDEVYGRVILILNPLASVIGILRQISA